MKYCSRIVLVDNENEFFTPEAVELIKLIDTQKSIKAAADVMKISDGPASGAMPNDMHEGNTISPAATATSVSSRMIHNPSSGSERSLPK